MAQGTLVYTALIIPLSSASPPPRPSPGPTPPPSGQLPGTPDQTLPGDLPRPSHPIWYPLPPGAPVDPSYGVPIERPDQGLPGSGRPDQGLPKPPGGPDQGLPPKPDQGLPGGQPHPEHPIVLPPDGGGWLPIYIWGGAPLPGQPPRPDQGLPGQPPRPSQGPGFPTPPIELPPDGETEDGLKIEFKCAWTPTTGWVAFAVVVPENVVTPSGAKKK